MDTLSLQSIATVVGTPIQAVSIKTLRSRGVDRSSPVYISGEGGGIFEFREEDPVGRGDDGSIVIRTPNGWRVRKFEGPVRAQWYAAPDVKSDQSEDLQRAIDSAASLRKPLHVGGGTWYVAQPLSLRRRYVPVRGNGMRNTTIRALTAGADPILDAYDEGEDVQQSPIQLSDIQIHGGSQGVNGIEVNQRHLSNIENAIIQFCKIGMLHRYDWLSRYCNVDFRDNEVGARTEGWSNRVTFASCAFNQNERHGYEARQMSKPNRALSFTSCDFEYNGGIGFVNDAGSPVEMNGCYFELNRGTANVEARSSQTVISGGFNLYNPSRTGAAAYSLAGGSIVVSNTQHTVERGESRWLNLVHADGGKIHFEDCDFVQSKAGEHTFVGTPFAVRSGGSVVPHQGRCFNVQSSGDAAKRVAVPSDPAAIRIVMEEAGGVNLHTELSRHTWKPGGNAGLILEYAASTRATLCARLMTALDGMSRVHTFASRIMGTEGEHRTHLKLDATWPETAGEFLYFGIIAENRMEKGDTLTLHKATLTDGYVTFPENLAFRTATA